MGWGASGDRVGIIGCDSHFFLQARAFHTQGRGGAALPRAAAGERALALAALLCRWHPF
jgi:hypothetical protein